MSIALLLLIVLWSIVLLHTPEKTAPHGFGKSLAPMGAIHGMFDGSKKLKLTFPNNPVIHGQTPPLPVFQLDNESRYTISFHINGQAFSQATILSNWNVEITLDANGVLTFKRGAFSFDLGTLPKQETFVVIQFSYYFVSCTGLGKNSSAKIPKELQNAPVDIGMKPMIVGANFIGEIKNLLINTQGYNGTVSVASFSLMDNSVASLSNHGKIGEALLVWE